MKSKTQFGWHFLGKTLRDGSPIPKNGVWLLPLKNLVICQHCYHGSKEPWDALYYAPGTLLTYCEYRGDFVRQEDKFGASQRRIIKRMDVTELLHYFARMQALSVIHLWQTTPPNSVWDYLMTGDISFRSAAWSAARSAAESAARSAAWSAARNAAESAARKEFNELVYECFF